MLVIFTLLFVIGFILILTLGYRHDYKRDKINFFITWIYIVSIIGIYLIGAFVFDIKFLYIILLMALVGSLIKLLEKIIRKRKNDNCEYLNIG